VMKVLIAIGLSAVALAAFALDKTVRKELKDGYVRVETPSYTIEVPKAWSVSAETPWGARKLSPDQGKAEMGTMTAGPTRAGWEELLRTSMYFILREEKGKPTPNTISRTSQGYEACSFSVLDEEGFAKRRYVLLKNSDGRVLALNVRIPDRQSEAALAKHFERLVRTARFAD